jgi:putative DNA-invertase from lambdoid prophage Rac
MVKKQIRTCALYCRVSTGDQSTAMQAADLRRYAAARDWEVVEVVEEKASGAKTRPRREALIAAAKAGKFDAVLTWSLSRWGRSNIDLLQTVKALDEAHVAFVSLKEGFDASTSQGRLVMGVLATLSEFEREQIVERVTAGIAHAWPPGDRGQARHGDAGARPSGIIGVRDSKATKPWLWQRASRS